jgi:hypothetical protein
MRLGRLGLHAWKAGYASRPCMRVYRALAARYVRLEAGRFRFLAAWRLGLALLFALAPVALAASPVTFGTSWDGPTPGTFADITGADNIMAGHPDFAAGMYLVSITGGRSALYNDDTIGLEGDTVCAVSATGCALGKPAPGQMPTVLQVSMDRPWHLWGWSPAIGKSLSTGSQFAFTQTSPTTWAFGYEDLSLLTGDADYQDVLGTITFLHGIDPPLDPTPTAFSAQPVPESSTWLLVGVGLLGVCLSRIDRRAR